MPFVCTWTRGEDAAVFKGEFEHGEFRECRGKIIYSNGDEYEGPLTVKDGEWISEFSNGQEATFDCKSEGFVIKGTFHENYWEGTKEHRVKNILYEGKFFLDDA